MTHKERDDAADVCKELIAVIAEFMDSKFTGYATAQAAGTIMTAVGTVLFAQLLKEEVRDKMGVAIQMAAMWGLLQHERGIYDEVVGQFREFVDEKRFGNKTCNLEW